MKEFVSEILAIARSGSFAPYTQGVPVRLPTGETVVIKVERTAKSIRPVGYRFSAFSYMTEVRAGNVLGVGYGEGSTQFIALQKSVAEGVERAVFKALKGSKYGTANTNGWAAHINRSRAIESATDELVERDSILVHWLHKIPFTELLPTTWPRWLTDWTTGELRLSPRFSKLRVLLSSRGYKPTVTTVLSDQSGYAVLSHATALTLNLAIEKALAETCRIAHVAMDSQHTENSKALFGDLESNIPIGPEDHAMFYAFQAPLPAWIFGEQVGWALAQKNWKTFQRQFTTSTAAQLGTKFHQITGGPLVVGFATSDLIQSLYFGRTQDAQTRGFINVRRLRMVKHEGEIYLMPHCVP